MYLNLSNDGYLLSVSKTPIVGGIEYDTTGFDFSGVRLHAHRYDFETKTLVLDEERLAELEAEDQAAVEAASAPTQLDRIEAQATYTAMMTDTLLEV